MFLYLIFNHDMLEVQVAHTTIKILTEASLLKPKTLPINHIPTGV